MKSAILEKVGQPGVVGVGLLLLCMFFYFGVYASVRTELASLDSEKAQLLINVALRAAAIRDGIDVGAARDLRKLKPLQPLTEAPELLKQLNALADKHGVIIGRTAYGLNGNNGGNNSGNNTVNNGPPRIEVGMPLKASYPALRAYLRDALALSPAASLDQLNLQRANAGDPIVEAQVRLSYGFAKAELAKAP